MKKLPAPKPTESLIFSLSEMAPLTIDEARLLAGEAADRVLSVADRLTEEERAHAGEYVGNVFDTLDQLEAAGQPFTTLGKISFYASRMTVFDHLTVEDLDQRRPPEEFEGRLVKADILTGVWLGNGALADARMEQQLRGIAAASELAP